MATAKKKGVSAGSEAITWPFGKKNYLLFGIAILVIAVGYIFLGQGSTTLAPILLVVGYCVLVPVSIIIRDNSGNSEPLIDDSSEE
jgi:hypothetical protein